MQLTQFSDFSLRALIYLAAHPEELTPISRVAEAFGISAHHLTKAAKQLIQLGYVEGVRGRQGGLRLAMEPDEIVIGEVIRKTEPHLDIVECFSPSTNTCPIRGACELENALKQANDAFFKVLDGYTLADLVRRPQTLVRLLG